uniref:Putative secreted protein n=1 Tax=Ixodes ricinus TaxID=34613 RepID=A0A090XCW8_IXORI
MVHLTSSGATAFVLLFVLLVERGACARPECDFREFYKLYSPFVYDLNFKVTGESNIPYIQKTDCDNLKNVTQRVETFLQGCSADKNEFMKEKITALRLTKESLCGSELQEDLNLWRDCFNPSVFAGCKKNVEERLDKLEQDGALDNHGRWCRNESLSYQCALKAGAGCPDQSGQGQEGRGKLHQHDPHGPRHAVCPVRRATSLEADAAPGFQLELLFENTSDT